MPQRVARSIIADGLANTDLTRERYIVNLKRKALVEHQAIESQRREAEQEEERLKLHVDSRMRLIETKAAVKRTEAELKLED